MRETDFSQQYCKCNLLHEYISGLESKKSQKLTHSSITAVYQKRLQMKTRC